MVKIEKGFSKKWVFPLVYVLYVLLIFRNSLDPADVSSMKSGAVLAFLNDVLFSGKEVLTEHLVRKMAHFSEYALAGVLGWMALRQFARERVQCFLNVAFAGLLMAFCDETIQLFVPGRSGQVSDMWIDFSGYLLGMFVCVLGCLVVKRLRMRKQR